MSRGSFRDPGAPGISPLLPKPNQARAFVFLEAQTVREFNPPAHFPRMMFKKQWWPKGFFDVEVGLRPRAVRTRLRAGRLK